MIKRDLKRLTMIQVTTAYLEEHKALWVSKKPFANKMAQVVANTADISDLLPQTLIGTKGSTQQKWQYKQTLLNTTLYLLAAGSSYAVETNNAGLTAQLNMSKSDLMIGSHQACLGRCQNIAAYLTPYADKLTDYGVEPAHFTAQEEACKAFSEVLSKPVSTRKDIKTANQQLARLIAATVLLFVKHIDNFVKMMAMDQPAFYAAYKNVRKIGGSGTSRHEKAVDAGTP